MSVSMLYGAESAIAAPSGTAAAQAPKPQAATTAADIASARVAARLSGQRVEALSERTETSTTWANKDGSLTSEVAAGPIRYRDPATGQWRDVDVDLATTADGSVTSKAHPQGLRLSGKKGTKAQSLGAAQSTPGTDLVTLGQGDEAITLQWRGGLPAPVLHGTRATYPEAVPGADVVVEATRTGFEQFVEVKAKPAAGFSYTLPLKTKGLKVEQQPDGSVLFTDKKSKKTATMPAPVMWDSTVDEASGEHTRRAKVGLKVVRTKDGADLVITPDAGFLADPATKYPVTVDPSTSSLGNLFDTYVQQGETVDWSNDTELDLGNPGTKNADGTWRTARSFITWNTAPVADALISNAKLSLWNFHSGNTDCTAQPWEVWTSNGPTTASRWTNQPAMVTKMATSTQTKGNPGCTSQPDGWIDADVTSLVQHWSNNKWTFSSMGLRATDENNIKQWKRVNSANAATNVPKLTVTYNYRPRTGTNQEAGPPFFSYGGAYTVNTLTPTLRDTFVDANGDKVNGTFQIFDSVTDTQVGNVIVSPWVPSGQAASVTVPAGVLTNGKTYKFRTSPYDGTHYNLGWSAWKTFTVDTSAPSAPTGLTSTDYPSNAWVKGKGKPGNFTVTPPAGDHNWLEWSLDGTTWTKVHTGGAAGAKTLSVTPPTDGTQTLSVRAVDKADNKSETADYTFHAGPGGFVQPSEGTRTVRRLPLLAESDAAKYDKASFSWRRSDADAWTQIPAGHVTANGTALTAWPIPLTAGKSAPLVWNTTDTVTPDGSIQIKADFTGPAGATGATDPLAVVVDRNADGAATTEVGPGNANLLTGDYRIAGTEETFFGVGATRTASSRRPGAGATAKGQVPIFGNEWVSGAVAETSQTGFTHIRKTSDTSLDVVMEDGSAIHFTAQTAAATTWVPEPGAEMWTLTGSFASTFSLTGADGTESEFGKVAPTAETWQVTSSGKAGVVDTTTEVISEAVTVGTEVLARPKMLIAPGNKVPAQTCAATPSTKGCRLLEFVYPQTTTATTLVFGDYKDRVAQIRLWATEPGAANSVAKTVGQYLYDNNGRLRQTWDPRISPALKTAYDYDSAGRVTSLTPPGELGWTFTYGNVGGAAGGDGMLLKASRPTLKQGSKTETDGTASTSFVYNIPLTGAAAPKAMGSADVAAWGQSTAPTDATAVFPSDSVPASHNGASLTAGSYGRATVRYLNASGLQVNTRDEAGNIETTEYDRFGNTVRRLSAGNRALALGGTQEDTERLTRLGITALNPAERAELLSERSIFSADGTRTLETLGSLKEVTLAKALTEGSTTLVAAGSTVSARPWTVNTYDEGRPTDGSAVVRNQLTSTVKSAQLRDLPAKQADARLTRSTYDWAKGVGTATIEDPAGLAITTSTQYDSRGRAVKAVLPGSNGNDAATTTTEYYTADGTGACSGRPEWVDLICRTGPAGAITGGGSNPSALPTKTYEYNVFAQITKITEVSGGTTRTTSSTYDSAGRLVSVTVTGGLGTAAPVSTTEHDPANGRVSKIVSNSAGTVTKQYDMLGRIVSYADADAGVTATEYDSLNRPIKVADSVPSTATITYDHTKEPRGLATAMADSVAGSFTAAYDADGAVVKETLPGGFTMRQNLGRAGALQERTYTRDSDGILLLGDSVTESVHGQRLTHTGGAGHSERQEYTYDAIGRLTKVADTYSDVCTVRGYGFDSRSNRTSLTTSAGTPGADCPATGGTTKTSAFDSADRIVDAGYAYDKFGRTTTMPGGATLSYYNSDLVEQQTLGTSRQTWSLDPAQRTRTFKTESNSGGSWTQTASRTNHYASDADSPRWITEDAAGRVTRMVQGLAGGLAATTSASGDVVLQLSNLHGDVSLALPLDVSKPPTALSSDEYGKVRGDSPATRYQWLGAAQRSSETLGGTMLMGARVYNPDSGRFLQVDPVQGGSRNAYEYVGADPANAYDLDGRWTWSRTFYRSWGKLVAQVYIPGWGRSAGYVVATGYFNYRWTWRIKEYSHYAYGVAAALSSGIPTVGWLIAVAIGGMGAWIQYTAHNAINRGGRCLAVSAGASIWFHKYWKYVQNYNTSFFPWQYRC
ncbi:DNRLRE domain-containing protein [Streptomyces sp. A0592]|uniref:DNRLRE domain-containing protein n=1 Tax=Streptomyces sp. A0592 TaxID=2563099 RepID=UPI00109ED731|nr:DNRLRE domain-containing protein [Streptomyces sp. A0592]THA79745.1 DNRLRE domain-containing protein [Streptomyces sp. A0592]